MYSKMPTEFFSGSGWPTIKGFSVFKGLKCFHIYLPRSDIIMGIAVIWIPMEELNLSQVTGLINTIIEFNF